MGETIYGSHAMHHLLVKHAICAVLMVYLTEAFLDLDLPGFVLLLCMLAVIFGVELAYGRFLPKSVEQPLTRWG